MGQVTGQALWGRCWGPGWVEQVCTAHRQGKALKGSDEDGVHPSWWAYKHAYPPYTALALE